MAHNSSFLKKMKAEKRRKKKEEKEDKKAERKKNSLGGALEDMLAYVDEFGNLTSTPPEKNLSKETKTITNK